MTPSNKQLSNPFSTGGGGTIFETRVQAAFTVLMLTGGFAPCLPQWPIQKIKLQGKRVGYDTDDLIVFAKDPASRREAKLLAQVKHSISITMKNRVFKEVIDAAWTDYNKASLFNKDLDKIALITGPLSATDAEVRTILEWARHSESALDFLEKVGQTKFSSKTKKEKLAVLCECLKRANGRTALSDDQLWEFLKQFYLLEVDLDLESGFIQSVIGSLITQYTKGDEAGTWAQIINMVQTENQNEGAITGDSIPEEIRTKFLSRAGIAMPTEIAEKRSRQAATDWSQKEYAPDLGRAFLMGGWNDTTPGDRQVGTKLSNRTEDEWIESIRRTLQDPDVPLSLRNGVWSSKNRPDVWNTLGRIVLDSDLESFRGVAVEVLSERDPRFELPPDERYMANIKGKVMAHSGTLRQGIADTLAVMGGKPEVFSNCSDGKAETEALLAVREVLAEVDWVLWASLNNLLPLLAEAAPNEFLSAVERSIQADPCPFCQVFAEEGNSVMGNNYMTGLLWALETLAWDERYLTRVAVILAELSVIDPGGNWSNRPANSLTTIFLPWHPQTLASVEKRQTAIRTVVKEVPTSAWATILKLLPSQHQMTSGSHKPRWRHEIPEDHLKDGIPRKEYWEQVSCYAELALEMAQKDTARFEVLVKALDTLPPPIFDKLLEHLASDDMAELPEKQRTSLWSALVEFTARHRRYADADWALQEEILKRIDGVTAKLAPKEPLNLYQRIFNGRDFDLYDEDEGDDWKEKEKKLEERRQKAIGVIYEEGGIEAVLQFVQAVESAPQVGAAFGVIAKKKEDDALLPELLDSEDEKISGFIRSYVWARRWQAEWDWVDQVVSPEWTIEQQSVFFRSLPFCPEAWKRVATVLGRNEAVYWKSVHFNSFQARDDYKTAIDKLLEHGRPYAAIDCLNASRHDKRPLDHKRTVDALLAAVNSEETPNSHAVYECVELIKALQDDPNTDQDALFRVEWAYLAALDGHRGATPKLIEHRLAADSQFFCEVIRIIFRSRHEKKEEREPTEREKHLASHAYRLLHEWKTPPGTQSDDTFSTDAFEKWLKEVKALCEKTGHLEVALSQLGHVLIFTPPDPNGLWINEAVADALNSKNAEEMRSGFRTGVFNSRGVHWVDPTGAPEKALAEQYKTKAENAEKAGYHRLADTMRSLAESYEREADRIITEHKDEQEE